MKGWTALLVLTRPVFTGPSFAIFTDLFALSSYLIPARALPALPDSVSTEMGYRYASGK